MDTATDLTIHTLSASLSFSFSAGVTHAENDSDNDVDNVVNATLVVMPPALSATMLRQIELFKPLREDEAAAVSALFRARTFAAGALIFQRDDPGDCLYLIRSGRVRIVLPSEDGRAITLRIYGPGEVFGELSLLDGGPRTASAEAVEAVDAALLFRDDFLALLRVRFELVQHVITLLVERLRYTTRYTEQLAFMSIPGRVAAALLQLRAPDQARIAITQQDLASYVGVTREWVNRTLREFETRGWVTLTRGALQIVNAGALESIARQE